MIVAVSSAGPSLDDAVDERFGRARFFVAVEADTGEIVEVVDNNVNREAMGGAGTASAETVSGFGAKAVVTGHLGPKAFSALSAAGIPGYAGTGRTVAEAVQAFTAHELEPLASMPTGLK